MLLRTEFITILTSAYYWISLAVYANLFMGLTLSITYEKYFWMTLALLANVIMIVQSSREKEGETVYENSSYIA